MKTGYLTSFLILDGSETTTKLYKKYPKEMREDQQKIICVRISFSSLTIDRKFSVYKIRRFVEDINSNSLRIQQESKLIEAPEKNLYFFVNQNIENQKF